MQLGNITKHLVCNMISDEQVQQNIMGNLAGSRFTAVKNMYSIRGSQGFQGEVHGLCGGLVNESIAGSTSVDKSVCICLNTT